MTLLIPENVAAACSFAQNCSITLGDVFARRDIVSRDSRKTKLICTLGPQCNDVQTLVNMLDAGMDIARFNLSHGSPDTHYRALKNLRQSMKARPRKHVGLIMEIRGPQLRSGTFTKGVETLNIEKDQSLRIVADPEFLGGVGSSIGCNYERLPQIVKVGDKIQIADGDLTCQVVRIEENVISARAMNAACIGERKNMSVSNHELDLPTCTNRDVRDILEFCIPNQLHYIVAANTRNHNDICEVRNVLGQKGRHVKVIARIQCREGVKNIDSIIREADGIVIDRGDLAMALNSEQTFLAQKLIVQQCNRAGKPVTVATELLSSMMTHPHPSKAEISDIANAVMQGVDGVELDAETASGRYPALAVKALSRVCTEAESAMEYHPKLFSLVKSRLEQPLSVSEALCIAAVRVAQDSHAAAIIALTETGHIAALLSQLRPRQTIFALASSKMILAQMTYLRGVVPVMIDSFRGTNAVIGKAILTGRSRGFLKPNDIIVVIHGLVEEISGHTNVLKVLMCP